VVLTYQAAVEAGARAWLEHDFPGTAHSWTAAPPHLRARYLERMPAVLEAVGYADLLIEVEQLRITVREDKRVMDRDATEVERLTGEAQDALWERTHALNERDEAQARETALREAVGIAIFDLTHGRQRTGVMDDLRAALHPEKGTDRG